MKNEKQWHSKQQTFHTALEGKRGTFHSNGALCFTFIIRNDSTRMSSRSPSATWDWVGRLSPGLNGRRWPRPNCRRPPDTGDHWGLLQRVTLKHLQRISYVFCTLLRTFHELVTSDNEICTSHLFDGATESANLADMKIFSDRSLQRNSTRKQRELAES